MEDIYCMYVQNAVPKNNLKLRIKTEYTYTYINGSRGYNGILYNILCLAKNPDIYTVTSASAVTGSVF